ncbi:MAG: hypothetical protein SGPRY_012524, partial [Prymnesium sp.]
MRVVSAASAVFMHLSPEHTYSAWHTVAFPNARAPANTTRRAIRTILGQIRPIFCQVATDADLRTHPRWTGPLPDDAGVISTLAFRWMLLYDSMVAAERARGRKYHYVLRARPDALLRCMLPPDVRALLGNFHAVTDKDFYFLMRRRAADIG